MSVKNSYQKYQADLEAKRKLKEEAEKRKRAIEEEAEQLKRKSAEEDKVSKIDAGIKSKRAGITVSDETISEGNKKLQLLFAKNAFQDQKFKMHNRKSKWDCKGNRHFGLKFQSFKANKIQTQKRTKGAFLPKPKKVFSLLLTLNSFL